MLEVRVDEAWAECWWGWDVDLLTMMCVCGLPTRLCEASFRPHGEHSQARWEAGHVLVLESQT